MARKKRVTRQAVELDYTHIVANRDQTYSPLGGGGYALSGNGWGLQAGPHRGTGGGVRFPSIHAPSLMTDLMNEQIFGQIRIDQAFESRFRTLSSDTESELKEKKIAAKATRDLSSGAEVVLEQTVTLGLIEEKFANYKVTAPKIYGMHGHSPYYLMEVMPRVMMKQLIDSRRMTPKSLMALWKLYDDVYRAALELKVLPMAMDILAAKLSELGLRRRRIESGKVPTQEQQLERITIIIQERDIHYRQMPEFLQLELAKQAGTVAKMKLSAALKHHRMTLERMAAAKLAAVKPIVAPPSFKQNGLTFRFAKKNPKIKAPLSKPELEALHELVHLQNHTKLGRKWISHHDALLKEESARHLKNTAVAFGSLENRANDAELVMEALKFVVGFQENLTARLGDRATQLAKQFSDQARGKRIRSAQQAIKAFNLYKDVLNKKFGLKDRQAIASALASLDHQELAQRFKLFSRAFGIVGKAMDVGDVIAELRKAIVSGQWNTFFLKLETLLLGEVATLAVALLLTLLTGTVMGIFAFALIMAITSALITDERVAELNEFILNL